MGRELKEDEHTKERIQAYMDNYCLLYTSLLRGERLYEETVGDNRRRMEHELQKFEMVLNTRDRGKIEEAAKHFSQIMEEVEEDNL